MKKLALLAIVSTLAVIACGRAVHGRAGTAAPVGAPPPGSAAAPEAPEGSTLSPAVTAGLSAELESLGFQVPTAPLRYVDFTLMDLDGKKRSLESFAGQVILLNFWATWCPPCRAEMPSMESLHRELKDEGLVILAVNSQQSREEVGEFVVAGGYTFPVLLDESGRVGASYAVRAIPTTYLVDRHGYILGRITGSRDWHTAEALSVLRRVLES
jgi:thiol-disulfide isomerase/thioredoxin